MVGVAIILIALAAYTGYSYWDGAVPTSTGNSQDKPQGETEQKDKKQEERYVSYKDNNEIEEAYPLDMNEYALQDAIHQMSHQKVEADKKWGAIHITPELIERLLVVVETNSSEYRHADTYLDILQRWENGDFSKADKDHNKIWDLQNGTVGKATGLLTASEEQKFIERHFE